MRLDLLKHNVINTVKGDTDKEVAQHKPWCRCEIPPHGSFFLHESNMAKEPLGRHISVQKCAVSSDPLMNHHMMKS